MYKFASKNPTTIVTVIGLVLAVLLIVVTVSGQGIGLSPEGVFEERIELAADETYTIENFNDFAVAFRWQDTESFEVSVDGGYFFPVADNHDLYDRMTGEAYSILYFPDSTISLRTAVDQQIDIVRINPSTGNSITTSDVTPVENGADYSGLNIISRAAWGADESKFNWNPGYLKVNKMIVHHTAWPNDPGDYARTVRAIYLFHAETRGWGDIGYNYLIDPEGRIYQGRKGGFEAVGAHAYMSNAGSVGIAMMGDYSNQNISGQARSALEDLLVDRANLANINLDWDNTVFGHRDMPNNNTVCPGNALYNQLPSIVDSANQTLLSQVDNPLQLARAQAEADLAGFQDSRIEVVYTAEAVSGSTVSELIPNFSGIVDTQIDESNRTAVLTIENIPGYYGDWSDDTLNRIVALYTIFLLDEQVESVRTAALDPEFYTAVPSGNYQFQCEARDNTYAKANGFIQKGSGTVTIYDETAGELWQQYDVNSDDVRLSYNRNLNLYFDNKRLQPGSSYRVEVCDGCVTDMEGNAIPAYTWQIQVSKYQDIYRFFNRGNGAHFFTTSCRERDKVNANLEGFDYEGASFLISATSQNGEFIPVYRFFNTNNGAHFYTASKRERDKVINDLPMFIYEGSVFYVSREDRADTRPLFRFFNTNTGAHFYTVSERERDKVISELPMFEYEGVAFYVGR